ncbi:hypothetical protein PsorP6_003351 [Peronosclerospora sorghi]|uniref:Uncharacterized protein n=1 Tax=Peronosclerospora sorghi TaxID=230839 RepID=A0ACC0VKI3_9STRA|nr:hypothetical protein PsorP6_003351 [Peronosclerospora sorghi]
MIQRDFDQRSVGGLAKPFLIPGWRVGWIMVHYRYNVIRDVRTAYLKLSQNILGANSLVSSSCCDLDKEAELKFIVVTLHQSVIPDILTPAAGSAEEQSLVDSKSGILRLQTDVLTKINDDFDFTQKLLEKESVFVLPGQCFGMTNYFRIVFYAPHDVLRDAYNHLAEFCRRHE